jgi:hypothetical protein
MEAPSAFTEWFAARLDRMSLDGETLSEYLGSVLADDDAGPLKERVESVLTMIEPNLDGADVPPNLADEITKKWVACGASDEDDRAASAAAAAAATKAALSSMRGETEAHEAAEERADALLSPEERLAKDLMLAAYDVETEFDEDGNIVYREDELSDFNMSVASHTSGNRGAQSERDRAMRARSKAAAAAKKNKDKEDLARDRKRKEDRKKKSVKQERRGGR